MKTNGSGIGGDHGSPRGPRLPAGVGWDVDPVLGERPADRRERQAAVVDVTADPRRHDVEAADCRGFTPR
jgi:hypothetical protein